MRHATLDTVDTILARFLDAADFSPAEVVALLASYALVKLGLSFSR